MADAPRKSLRHRLYHGETSFDFVGKRKLWFILSSIVIGIGILSLATQGLNYGIDFEGGTSWTVQAPGVSVDEARDRLSPLGLGDAKIQIEGSDQLRVQADSQEPEDQVRVTEAMADMGNVPVEQVSVNDVGPSWGEEVTKKARNALIVFFVLITAYISLRFEWKMALAAIAAVVHDILVTVGVYSVSRFEVTPATVVAFLTILGYSLYDTIVVFDKVEENAKGLAAQRRMTYSDTVNLSMNQVLMRSLNTSLVAILPILSVLLVGAGLLGATTLKDFGLALLVGLITGAYSSIYIASPILAMLKEREPQYAGIRHRVEARGGSNVLTPAAAAAAAGAGSGERTTSRPSRQRDRAGDRPSDRDRAGDRPRDRVPADRVPDELDDELVAAPRKTTPPPRPKANQPGKPRSGGGGANRPAPRPRKKGKRR